MVQITFNEEKKQFHLRNDSISYIIEILDNGHLAHCYFGKQLNLTGGEVFGLLQNRPMTTFVEGELSLQNQKLEYPNFGTTDFRSSAFEIESVDGSLITDFKFKEHCVHNEKGIIKGLPHTRNAPGLKQLNIILEDEILELQLLLKYTVYPNMNSVVRSAEVINNSDKTVQLNKFLSVNIDLDEQYSKWVQLSGDWARERHLIERKLEYGTTSIESITGNSSAYHNPYVLLMSDTTTEDIGDSISVSLIYSGNHLISSEVNSIGINRIKAGINPTGFTWELKPSDSFQSPEAVLTYSDKGTNGNSIVLHRFINNHIVNPVWQNKERPLLINNWEATYFDFDSDSLLSIAAEASELGFNMFVLDDGWFGNRNSDEEGLGDWFVNEKKLQGGLSSFVEQVNDLGMDFGIWIEPEMVNTNSELFKSHPEWVVGHPNRRISFGRNQLVLDYSNPEVVNYIYSMLTDVFDTVNIKYIKWDMNRNITEPFSTNLKPSNQGEFYHRYILGVYDLYQRLQERYPKVLIEGCASGGNRFDLGILFYSPQIWTSDNTDGFERTKIQYGSSFAYPLSTMSSHISAVPNHQVGRTTPLKYRADIATFGTYGYELDPRKLTETEKEFIKEENKKYLERQPIILKGDFYRIINPFESIDSAWISVLPGKERAVAGMFIGMEKPNRGPITLKLKGLDGAKLYVVESTVYNGEVSGRYLMKFGIVFKPSFNGVEINRESVGDFQSYIFDIEEKRE